jgi:hypothetical protein
VFYDKRQIQDMVIPVEEGERINQGGFKCIVIMLYSLSLVVGTHYSVLERIPTGCQELVVKIFKDFLS